MRLAGQVACITGAGRGLGKAMAEELAKQGAIVVINDLDEENVKATVAEFKGASYQVHGYVADVTNKKQIQDMFGFIYKEYGKIDILVNNAGGSLYTPKKLEDIEEEHWDLVLNVNLKSTFLCSQEVVNYMKETGGGKIINVASIGARTASYVTGVSYAAAKGGIISFSRRLALEVGPLNIRVNTIAPGLVISGERMQGMWDDLNNKQQDSLKEEIPLSRLGTMEEQAKVVAFLASDDSIYMTGAVIDVNGGRFMG